ncbi:ABC transporter ATP-binding protein [Halanaerobium praevalens]|uniref:ABC transporter related protein n=1 Tax=Halanaerobium praevalens (strain ATCC 33744 / DSM 2228 / GSL) TaxID=572479 RepID=E3DLV3_HALPG|nr:ABC transporter ATP-binding protein [Halanaerobium praevalens]ADO76212.1 ABC transporter related protein [Halanaerobium praevalens DSM 2228]
MELEIDKLSLMIEGKKIIEKIKAQVFKGEFIGLIGPNGSGKSTLLKTIYRVLKPQAGLIKLDQQKLQDLSFQASAKKMAVVRQLNNFNFDFTVEEIVMMGRSPHKGMLEVESEQDYKIIYNALAKVNLVDYAARSFATLSGGEKQRVLIARALAQETELLILDEPTNHLDIRYKLQILDLIKSLKKEVLAAIHDLNLAVSYCDRIYVMKAGKIFAEGKPKTIITEDLLREVYQVEAKIIEDPETKKINIIYRSQVKNDN